MKKDTYYFSHDYNTRNDPKIKALIRKHGMTGYGIFWGILEDLYNNANVLPTDYEGIAFDLRSDCDIIKSIINDFDLFIINNGIFGSLSIERRLSERDKKSKNARNSALIRWSKKEEDAIAMRTHSQGNAIKERKGKEKKEYDNDESKNLKELPLFKNIKNENFLQMCRNVSNNTGRLTDISDYKNEYFRLIANKPDLHKQSGRSVEYLAEKAKDFIKEQSAVEKEWDNYTDYFKHFLNWVKKQPK